jgi:PAS domain S-box-containing protein
MQRRIQKSLVIVGFVVVALILAGNLYFKLVQLNILTQHRKALEHTQEVLLQISTLEGHLTQAETGQRGYLLTGDGNYLRPYIKTVDDVNSHVDKLAGLTSDNPSQQARIPRLRQLTKEKLDELERTVALESQGKSQEARAILLSDVGRQLMVELHRVLAEMRTEEERLDKESEQRVQQSTRDLKRSVYLATAISLLALALLAFTTLWEMSRREQLAEEVRKREQWFRTTLTSIGDAVIACDSDGRVAFLNPEAERMTGYINAAAQGKPVERIFPIFHEYEGTTVENPVQTVLRIGEVVRLANHTVLRPEGAPEIPIEDSAAPIRDDGGKIVGVVLVFRDVSREKRSREALRRADRLATAGRLAATIAHEVNNPLEAIWNLLYLVRTSPNLPPELLEPLTSAEQELERVSHISKQALGFYKDTTVPVRTNICKLVDSVLKMFESRFSTREVKLQKKYIDCPEFLVMQGEIRQVVSNLLSNSLDAVEKGGSIAVSVGPVNNNGVAGVEVQVQDNGPGIPAENLERIFEPFFTTKQDVGTGLGLWVARGIVERHGGSIRAYQTGNDGARGATVCVFLPATGALEPQTMQAAG